MIYYAVQVMIRGSDDMMKAIRVCVLFLSVISLPVLAAETTTYIYDVKGRLVRVVKSGGPNNGTTTSYNHDNADNRTRVQTTGAPR